MSSGASRITHRRFGGRGVLLGAGSDFVAGSVLPSMIRVCFVCLGNICRSPVAEGVMRHLVEQAGLSHVIEVASAGTSDYHVGELPDRRSRAAAKRRGIDLSSRARQFTARDWQNFDYVLAMDAANARDLRAIAPDADALAKVLLLRSFDPASPPDAAVPDPYYGGDQGFEHVLDLCHAACAGFLRHLREEHSL
jgi:protein-tyrosine phosphatase